MHRNAVLGSFAIIGLFFGFWGVCRHEIASGDARRLSQAAKLTHWIHGPIEAAFLVRALEGVSDPGSLEVAANLYRNQKAAGLTPQNALRAKVSDAQAAAVLHAFDPASLRLGEVLPVFAWFDRSSGKYSDEARTALSAFIRLPLEVHQEISLLDLGSQSARALALMRAKALGRPELLAAIGARLDQLSPQEKVEALEVLAASNRSLASPAAAH